MINLCIVNIDDGIDNIDDYHKKQDYFAPETKPLKVFG
jgi:hypothetical protein